MMVKNNPFVVTVCEQAHCSIANDKLNDLPTTSTRSENDASRLDLSIVVQLKKSRHLTNAEKYKFLNDCFVPAPNFHFPAKQHGSHNRSFNMLGLASSKV